MAPHNPAMSKPVPLFEASRTKALEDATAKAKSLAEQLTSGAT
jgi:FMN-dependent NADH-azoreductase